MRLTAVPDAGTVTARAQRGSAVRLSLAIMVVLASMAAAPPSSESAPLSQATAAGSAAAAQDQHIIVPAFAWTPNGTDFQTLRAPDSRHVATVVVLDVGISTTPPGPGSPLERAPGQCANRR